MDANRLHEQVWSRFVRGGHVLDFTVDAESDFPTSKECRFALPNIFAYGTAVKDGAMFGGMYLYGLCTAWQRQPSPALEQEIRILAEYLRRLCDGTEVPGFIPRFLAEDGKSRYPCGSSDQTVPWVVGMWKLLSCGPDTEPEQDRKRILRTVRGVRSRDWKIPTELDGLFSDHISGHSIRSVSARLLFLQIEAHLSGEECGYLRELDSVAQGSIFTCRELVENGFADDFAAMPKIIQMWLHLMPQLCLKELAALDPENAESFRRGMKRNAVTVLPFTERFVHYSADERPPFSSDWRQLLPYVQPCILPEERVAEAHRLNSLWTKEFCRGYSFEHRSVGDAAFSCWIVMACGEKRLRQYAAEKLNACIETVDWPSLRCSFAFAAECAVYEYESNG